MKNVFYLLFLGLGISVNAQVAINADNSNPDPSAMLEVKSTTKGILVPRMTQAQRNAIVSPANGLMIYQTNNSPGFYYNSGTSAIPVWVIAGTGSGWGLTGNSGISSIDFLGTTDNVPLVFKVNNSLAGKIDHLLTNTSLGYQSLAFNTTGNGNTACGQEALYSNTTGINNTANGKEALYSNTTGYHNTAEGVGTLYSNTSGNYNTANGSYALALNTTGLRNTANGYGALYENTTGAYNTANGNQALFNNVTGLRNTANGSYALNSNTTGNYNTASGADALRANTTGYDNTANGTWTLYSNTTGYDNTANGYYALFTNNTGYENTANGMAALASNTSGFSNTASGRSALSLNTIGDQNTAFGYGSGSLNDANNTCSFFGYDADQNVLTNFSNSTALGNASRITASNQVRIGSSTVTSIGGFVGWSNISDGRYKKDVKSNVPGLAFINQLTPVTYHLDVNGISEFLGEEITGAEGREDFRKKTQKQKLLAENGAKEKEQAIYSGFIAQDVEKAANFLGFNFSGIDAPENENDLYSLRYAEFVVPLVKAVQELNELNEAQKTIITELKLIMEELKSQNQNLIQRIEKLENK